MCRVLNDAHTTSLYNSITGSIIFPIAQTKISGDIGIINTINRMRNKNSVALLFRGYSFLNNVGTSLSFVANVYSLASLFEHPVNSVFPCSGFSWRILTLYLFIKAYRFNKPFRHYRRWRGGVKVVASIRQ